jgi:hypothetical protein
MTGSEGIGSSGQGGAAGHWQHPRLADYALNENQSRLDYLTWHKGRVGGRHAAKATVGYCLDIVTAN